MTVKYQWLCALLSPLVIWGMTFLYCITIFDGQLLYLGRLDTLAFVLSFFTIMGIVSFFGFHAGLSLVRRYPGEFWSIALFVVNAVSIVFPVYAFDVGIWHIINWFTGTAFGIASPNIINPHLQHTLSWFTIMCIASFFVFRAIMSWIRRYPKRFWPIVRFVVYAVYIVFSVFVIVVIILDTFRSLDILPSTLLDALGMVR